MAPRNDGPDVSYVPGQNEGTGDRQLCLVEDRQCDTISAVVASHKGSGRSSFHAQPERPDAYGFLIAVVNLVVTDLQYMPTDNARM